MSADFFDNWRPVVYRDGSVDLVPTSEAIWRAAQAATPDMCLHVRWDLDEDRCLDCGGVADSEASE